MATAQQIETLKKVAAAFQQIDRDKLLRTSLGTASLKEQFGPKLESMSRKLEFASEYAANVSDQYVSSAASTFEQARQQMEAQAGRNDAEYVARREEFLRTMEGFSEPLLYSWPAFIASAIETRGFLEDEGIRKEYQRTIDSMKGEAEGTLKRIKDEASKTIEEARLLAQQIEERARRTAAHISVDAAQEQFRIAQGGLRNQVLLWGFLSVSAITGFILFGLYLTRVHFPAEWKWQVIYYSAIRITILSAIGALATFCLRVLRAHMHMSQHNLHRQRIANSMAAFVESAATPEQRDLILGRLVEAVSTFGSSGLLLREDESIYSPKMVIDAVTRTLTSPTQKS